MEIESVTRGQNDRARLTSRYAATSALWHGDENKERQHESDYLVVMPLLSRAFSAVEMKTFYYLGRCPRLAMTGAPLALIRNGETV